MYSYFAENHAGNLEDYVVCCVPGKGERPDTDAIGGIPMGYFITRKACEDPAKQAAAVEFVSQLTSDETLSTFVTTEITALKNGASPSGLNAIQESAAKCNANITGIVGAAQDTITAEAKGDLFANVQKVVAGQMTAAEAGEIGEMVGYADTAHFARIFKKLEGMSTNEYRNGLKR